MYSSPEETIQAACQIRGLVSNGLKAGNQRLKDGTTPTNRKPASSKPKTRTLVRKARDGDKEAFSLLYLKFKTQVHNLIRVYAVACADTEQLTQDTFLRAYVQLGCLRDSRSFEAWLKKIARNLVLEDRRRQKRRQHEALPENLVSSTVTPEHQLYQREKLRLLELALGNFPKFKQELIGCVACGFTDRETSDSLGRSVASVKLHKYRIRKYLSRTLVAGEQETERP